MADITITRPARRSGATAMWAALVPLTYRVWGTAPAGRTLTKASPSYRDARAARASSAVEPGVRAA